MKVSVKRLAFLVILFASFLAQAAKLPQVGDSPRLVVTDVKSESFDLNKKKGKWVLIHFFATWCPGCKTELPMMAKVVEKYRSKGLEIIALSPEKSRAKSQVKQFMEPFKIPSALIADAQVNDFGTGAALPTTYVIDAQGKVKKIFLPTEQGLTQKELEDALGDLTQI